MNKSGDKVVKPTTEKASKSKGSGVTSEAMKKYGRNLARAMNQKGSK